MFPVLSGLSLALACIYDLLWYTVYIFFFFFINYGDSFTNLKVYYDRPIMASYCTQLNDSLHHITTIMHVILTNHVITTICMAYCIFVFLLHQLPIVWAKTHLHDKPFSSSVSFTHRREYCTRIQRTLIFIISLLSLVEGNNIVIYKTENGVANKERRS